MNKNWLLFLAHDYSTAYADTDQPQELEKMVISNPGSVSEAETILPVSILSGDELRMKIAPTIGDTIDQEPGVTSQSFGPGVGQPVVRGQSGSRVQVLQNGLGSLDASSVSPDHANSLEPLWAESIEVIRGPAAALLYGSGAIGGVVNVIDNRIPDAVPDSLIQGALEQRYSSVNDGTIAPSNWKAAGIFSPGMSMVFIGTVTMCGYPVLPSMKHRNRQARVRKFSTVSARC